MPVQKQIVGGLGVYVRTALITLIICGAGLFAFIFAIEYYGFWHDEWSGYNARMAVSDGVCNVATVSLKGGISSLMGDSLSTYDLDSMFIASADQVVADIRHAAADPNVLGIMLQIDSPGGEGAGSEMIMDELKRTAMPTAALVRSMATSGAYLVASGADAIIASKFSDIGSIGVSMSYVQNANKNAIDGLEYVQLTSAEFKDYGTPERALTEDERALFERDLAMYHEVFVSQVAENRHLPVEQIQKLADGSSMPAELAWSSGLVDALGNEDTARDWFADRLDLNLEDVIFCR